MPEKRGLAPVTSLRGVSEKRAQLLAKLGIETLEDLLCHFPRSYEDWSSLSVIAALEPEQTVTVLALCVRVPRLYRRGRNSHIRASFQDASGAIGAIWFNQPYLESQIQVGHLYLLHGKVGKDRPLTLQNPALAEQPLPDLDQLQVADISPEHLAKTFVRPLYPLTAGLTQGVLRGLVRQTLGVLETELALETLPAEVRRRNCLCARRYAMERIHFPSTPDDFRVARRRLVFEELFFVQLGLRLLRRGRLQRGLSPSLVLTEEQERRYDEAVRRLPYALTGAQVRVLSEIRRDLEEPVPMDRLVQGDVGSGKTVVAALALYRAVLAGCQGLLMAPTSILAKQHAQTLEAYLGPCGVRIALLTGQTRAAAKRQLLLAAQEGEIDILVGTQALLNEDLKLARPALAVTDEQHRFGVQQRLNLLKTKEGLSPHVLVMSATPIPRSLALVLYGDLSVSILDEKPAGRLPIQTYTVRTAELPRAWRLLERLLGEGRQAYVICPLKTPGETGAYSAEEMAPEIQKLFPSYRVGLLHGACKEKEKQATMQAFAAREIDILVSTTVVEVGVDNPNATLLLVFEADRFGLAQLHQLRGRVGRGREQSYCLLHSDTDQSLARQRLVTLCKTADGYELAEKDLELRGPGDFFGTRQHGLPEFRIANLYEDRDLLVAAQKEVEATLREDPQLQQPEHSAYPEALRYALGYREDSGIGL